MIQPSRREIVLEPMHGKFRCPCEMHGAMSVRPCYMNRAPGLCNNARRSKFRDFLSRGFCKENFAYCIVVFWLVLVQAVLVFDNGEYRTRKVRQQAGSTWTVSDG